MNYREKIRKALECPQFGNINYGEWGTLRLDQRKSIKRLLDEMDGADEVIKHQFFEIERLNNIINKLEKELKEGSFDVYFCSKSSQKTFKSNEMMIKAMLLDKLKELKGE